jgi:flavodoxin
MKLKHLFMLAASAALSAVAFFGCNCDGNSCSDDASAKSAAKTKPLVVYWTWSETHNTKVVAEMLQEKTGADLKLIEMVTPYPNDFGSVMQLGQRDLAQPKAPAIKEMDLDLTQYDPIYVGTPIWFSTYAPPVRTFLQSYDFTGKTVALFCTHGQGNPATFKYLADAKAAVPEINYFSEVFAFKGTEAKNAGPALDAWIEKVSAK